MGKSVQLVYCFGFSAINCRNNFSGERMKKLTIFFKAILSKDHKRGTDHWLGQRVTSVAMVPLTTLFLIFFLMNYESNHEQSKYYFSNPFINGLSIIFFIITFLHLKQGLEVVIEDYISDKRRREIFLTGNKVFCSFIGLLCVVSLLSIYITD